MGFVEPKLEKSVKLHLAKIHARGATWIYGKNHIFSGILRLLGLDSERCAMVMVVHRTASAQKVRDAIRQAHVEARKKGGLAFTLPLSEVLGIRRMEEEAGIVVDKGDSSMNKQLIMIIVDKNRGDDIIDAAQQAGAPGATVLHGHGSGAEKVKHFVHLEIEPEKEIVMIVAAQEKTKTIIDGIRSVIDFDAPNTGILFTLDISDWMESGRQ